MKLDEAHPAVPAIVDQPCLLGTRNSPPTPHPPTQQYRQQELCYRHVTWSRRSNQKNMMMNFAVPFVLINLICTAATATITITNRSSNSNNSNIAGPFPNKATAKPTRNLPIIIVGGDGQHQQQKQKLERGVSAGNSHHHVPRMMMSGSDMAMDYVQEEGQASQETDSGNVWSKWSVLSQQKEQQQQQSPSSTDFQEHFYLNPKFKEKDVPVPFTFSNFKRQQPPSNFYTPAAAAAPFTSHHQGQAQPQPQRGRSPWSGQAAASVAGHDPSFTREITIKQGRVKGIVRAMYRDSGIRDVDQFLGLPYAESPVGNKRFMPPGKTLCTLRDVRSLRTNIKS